MWFVVSREESGVLLPGCCCCCFLFHLQWTSIAYTDFHTANLCIHCHSVFELSQFTCHCSCFQDSLCFPGQSAQLLLCLPIRVERKTGNETWLLFLILVIVFIDLLLLATSYSLLSLKNEKNTSINESLKLMLQFYQAVLVHGNNRLVFLALDG